jgi:hypothetical protein
MDEYLVHQTEKPLSEVASDHPEWQDRFYFNIHDRNGEFAAITGLGAFPNRNMTQAFLFAVYNGQHYAYLNVRPLAGDREVMSAGSLSYSIIEPQKAWRLEVGDEANKLLGDLEFQARCPLYQFGRIRWEDDGYVVANQMHYTQSGAYKGSFTIGGRTFTDLIGIRDRSWGIRDMRRVPVWMWISAQFPEFCVSAWRWETPEGEPIHMDGAVTYQSGETKPISGIEHELEIHPGTKRPRTGSFRLTTTTGEELSVTADEIQTIFLGPLSSRWPLGDAAALKSADAAAFGFDQHCRFTLAGQTGYGIVEYMMTGGSKRYGIPPTRLPG